eukprot:4430056-Amphidinium_carterae.1
MDVFGDHTLVCQCAGDRTCRHNHLWDIVAEECCHSNLRPEREKKYLSTDVFCKQQGIAFHPVIFEAHSGVFSRASLGSEPLLLQPEPWPLFSAFLPLCRETRREQCRG